MTGQLRKVKLSFWQIWNMNVGFFGIQYSFGLQQSAVNPIYDFLGAAPDEIPLLNLAGPVTGGEGVAVGGAAPDFTLADSAGKNISLADFEGKVVYATNVASK